MKGILRKSDGFTLIELIITIVVISIGLVGVVVLFQSASRGAVRGEVDIIAANLAHEKLEQVIFDKWRNGYDSVDSDDYPQETFSGDFNMYVRTTTVTEVDPSDLNTPMENSGYKRVNVRVMWSGVGGGIIDVSTIISDY